MPAPEKPVLFFRFHLGLLQKKLSSISPMPCQSSNLVIIPRSRNQLFPQSYDSCLQSRSAPSPSYPLSSQSSSLCIRLDILNVFTISSIHSNPFPPCLPFFSVSSLMSLRLLRRRMRGSPRHFCYFIFLPFRPSTLCNCSTRTSNP